MMAETSEPTRDAPKSKSKGKEKAREPSLNVESNKQLAHLLQCLHNAGVPEDVRINILQDLVVQIAFNQVLYELDIVTMQCNEACKNLYCMTMGREWTASFEEDLPQKIQKQDLP